MLVLYYFLNLRVFHKASNAVGILNDTLEINSNDPDTPSLGVPLVGQGDAPSAPNIAVTPPALDFGTVEVGAFKVDSVMVNNTGGDTLDITGLSLTPAALPFGATLIGPDRIPPGGMTKIHVRFEPGSAVVFSDTLRIDSNDPDTPVAAVPLVGQGVAPAGPPPATPANAHTGFGTALDTLQEIPAPIIPAGLNPTGSGWFTLNIARTEFSFHITVTGLSGPISAAHFHEGPFGVAGPPIRGFTPEEINGNTISGVWTGADAAPLTPERVNQLVNGDIYVNIHTDLNPPGEIRGQVRVKRHVGFTAVLNTTQEIPRPTIPAGLNPSGTGNFGFVPNPAGTVDFGFRITVDALSGPITAAHFHIGRAGEAGPPIRGFTPEEINGNTIKGRWKETDSSPLTRERRRQLFSDSIYVNIHTTLNGPGEIRGQVQFTTPFNPGPAIANVNVSRRIVPVGAPVRIFAEVTDPDGVISVDAMLMDPNDSLFVPENLPLFDDGAHFDKLPGDGLWGSDPFSTPPDRPRFFDVSIWARDELGQQTHEESIVSFETAFPVEVGAGEEIAGPGGQAIVPIFARGLGNPVDGDKGVVAGEITLRFEGPVKFLRAFPAPGREFPAGFDFFSPEDGKAIIAFASATPIFDTEDGILVFALFGVSPDAPLGTRIDILAQRGTFLNEGFPPVVTFNGSIMVALVGDISKNGSIRAFDAALALMHSVENRNIIGDFFGGDVDLFLAISDVTRDGTVSPFDAVRILQKVVGRIAGLPFLGEPRAPKAAPVSPRTVTISDASEVSEKGIKIPVSIDDMSGVLGAYMSISYDASKLKVVGVSPSEMMSPFMFQSNIDGDEVRIAFASADGLEGSGDIVYIEFEILPGVVDNLGDDLIRVADVQLNEGLIPPVIEQTELSLDQYAIPETHSFSQNYPNPFNPETVIHYDLPVRGRVDISVFNMMGQKVATLVDGEMDAGSHSVVWNAKDSNGENLASGVYLYRMETDGFVQTRKLILMR